MVPNRLSLLLRYEQLLDKFGMDFSRRENPDRNQLVADTTSFINSVSMKEKFASHTFIRLLKSSSELELFRPDLQSECFRVLEAVVVSRLYPWTYEFDAILVRNSHA